VEVLAIDIGGTKVMFPATGRKKSCRFPSGPNGAYEGYVGALGLKKPGKKKRAHISHVERAGSAQKTTRIREPAFGRPTAKKGALT
jgi:hypothetical protein